MKTDDLPVRRDGDGGGLWRSDGREEREVRKERERERETCGGLPPN